MSAELEDVLQLGPQRKSKDQKTVLIYFIPGNPGLIEYYRSFLVYVQEELQSSNVILYGASHDGFEFHAQTSSTESGQSHPPPYSLREEIDGVKFKLQRKAREIAAQQPGQPLQVILVGHSVGTYILLEVLEWWQSQPHEHEVFTLVSGICLFPTIVDMFKSDKGKVFQYVLEIPFLGIFLQTLIHLIGFFPAALTRLATLMTPGQKGAEGVEGADVTRALATSKHGVRQVIRMARDELREIKSDKWHDEHIWGNVDAVFASEEDSPGLPRTKLFFYWGEEDYWVHSGTRDELIAKRGRLEREETVHDTKLWPVMQVDQEGAPHTFGLFPEHSKRVAKVTAGWVDDAVKEQSGKK